MMLATSAPLESSGAATVARRNEEKVVVVVDEGVGGGSVSGEFGEEERGRGVEGERYFAGNRWPREETLALLKIRSDMDVAFRDSSLKAPLWEEVSRKLAERGFHRTAKKCKEKFENIHKYHRRTRDGRSGRPNGKTYRFFEQLEALDQQPAVPHPPRSPEKIQTPPSTETPAAMMVEPINAYQESMPCSSENPTAGFASTASTSTASSSGKEAQGTRKRKRKLSHFFERLMGEVIKKQENLQKQFIEAMEKCENDRVAREETWKMQELARIKRDQEILAHERAIAAAKDAAVIAFLQKISEKASPPVQSAPETANPPPIAVVERPDQSSSGNTDKKCSNINQTSSSTSSRWPKAEVEALIRLRTDLDLQYQGNGPKGPLWEDISLGMKKLGHYRSSKRCKEKWENINKYFKRVKDSNKKRPEDSKTCPYFHQLEALYKKKTSKKGDSLANSGAAYDHLKPEELLMQMMGRPGQEHGREPAAEEDDGESENADGDHEETGDDEDEEDEEEEGDRDGEGYQIVANINNPNSGSSMAVMG
ncbi:trihelix transcription factor DF1-like [Malania oleifera]|uniref:trihelix transcription factor DF1-like n=1 Tax=Malania oleifera TaxID=397392 RepID=UPI0025ADDA00|nr:trihelix transcription factor DF1-like [Malania oleifera]